MTEHSDSSDDVIQPVVPGRISVEVRKTSRGEPSHLLKIIIPGMVLLLGLVFVLVLLPRWVAEQPPPAEPLTQQEPLAVPPVETELDEETLAALREEAEILLTRMVAQEGKLKILQPEFWAAEAWQQYLDNLRAADDNFLAHDYNAAISRYRQGLDQGDELVVLAAQTLQQSLVGGNEALTAGDEDQARKNFELALSIDQDNAAALAGLARAERLADVLAAMTKARAADTEGNVEAAIAAYSDALAADPLWQPAAAGRAAARARLADYRFARAMSAGLAALDDADYATAEAAFKRALTIRQDAPAALDGLERVDQGRRLGSIKLARIRATAFETQERWEEAVQQYEAALALDNTVMFAQDGAVRSRARSDMDQKLTLLIEQPSLLFDARVLEDARQLLTTGEAMPAPRAKLEEQLRKLGGYVDQAGTPITVTFVSDGVTQVTLYRVGPVGSFERHDLALRPGDYTAVGSRNGYRDVRAQFKLRPGQKAEPVVIRCTEPI